MMVHVQGHFRLHVKLLIMIMKLDLFHKLQALKQLNRQHKWNRSAPFA
uniref:E3 ubiquitin-protein ligase RGLG1 isoform X3 n=1 Tax=Rhizophora mucronata TaxID=61149 RepID=A0A2P2KRK5_RHIMU